MWVVSVSAWSPRPRRPSEEDGPRPDTWQVVPGGGHPHPDRGTRRDAVPAEESVDSLPRFTGRFSVPRRATWGASSVLRPIELVVLGPNGFSIGPIGTHDSFVRTQPCTVRHNSEARPPREPAIDRSPTVVVHACVECSGGVEASKRRRGTVPSSRPGRRRVERTDPQDTSPSKHGCRRPSSSDPDPGRLRVSPLPRAAVVRSMGNTFLDVPLGVDPSIIPLRFLSPPPLPQ